MRHRIETRPGLTLVLALSLLLVAVGFCVFDHHAAADANHGHGVVIDLCLAVLGVAIVVGSFLVLTVLGWATPFPALILVPASPHVLDPPPKR